MKIKYIIAVRNDEDVIQVDTIKEAEKEVLNLLSEGWSISDINIYEARQLNFNIKIDIDTISA